MGRRKKESAPVNTRYQRTPQVEIEGFTISQGEIIKIKGQHGAKFRFANLVTDSKNGTSWVDCYEMYNGMPGGLRAFKIDRVKRIPTRRKRRVK